MANKCRTCNAAMTWAQQKVQYKRLMLKGFTPEQVKERAMLPRCQKCMTQHLASLQACGQT